MFFYAVFEARLHYHEMERNKIYGLKGSLDFDRQVKLSPSSIQELNWWVHKLQAKNEKRIKPSVITLVCRTDASLDGY